MGAIVIAACVLVFAVLGRALLDPTPGRGPTTYTDPRR